MTEGIVLDGCPGVVIGCLVGFGKQQGEVRHGAKALGARDDPNV